MAINIKNLIFNPLTALIISLLALFFWFSLYQTIQEITNSTQDTQVLRENIITNREKLEDLETEIEVTKSDFMREKAVRDELLMQKEGEIIVKIEDLPELEQLKDQVEKTESPWESWQELILHNK